MNKLDKQIRDALRQEDAELFDELTGEQTLPQMVIDSFRGRNWWLMVMVYFGTLIMFIAAIFCAVQFFTVDDLRQQLWWGAGVIFGMNAVGMLKMWTWMEMQKNAVTREVKRVELQIAKLAQRIGNAQSS